MRPFYLLEVYPFYFRASYFHMSQVFDHSYRSWLVEWLLPVRYGAFGLEKLLIGVMPAPDPTDESHSTSHSSPT